MSFKGQHILSVKQFDTDKLAQLFLLTKQMMAIKNGSIPSRLLEGKVLGNIFFEASTRSRMSFSSAFFYLGGHVNTTSSVQFSSMAKGESLADTIKVMSMYCDVLVVRHPEEGSVAEAAKYSQVPVVNAGDGAGEHPTQALLDLFTIQEECGRLSNLTVSFVGDLKYGRTIHSLARLLCLYPNMHLIFSAPQIVQLPERILNELQASNTKVSVTEDFDSALAQADVLYATRIQRERFPSKSDYESIEGKYVITKEKIDTIAKKNVVIMHPLPRTTEITTCVDALPNAAYFKQAQNGLFVRMALFLSILGVSNTAF
jgi:aspartate carbamoyltransferase catalytic subunit